jgi:hypothetical protein
MSHSWSMGSAVFWKRLHLTLLGVWIVLLPPTLLWWRNSISYLVLMSWYAIAIGHVSSWQASRAEQESEDG